MFFLCREKVNYQLHVQVKLINFKNDLSICHAIFKTFIVFLNLVIVSSKLKLVIVS